MGEAMKSPEEEKKEEKKEETKEEKEEEQAPPKAEELKKEGEEAAAAPPPPPPPEEIEMRVFMHCEGCARKVRRSLKGFDGVEAVLTDTRTHKVLVKGKKAAEDPLKVVDRVQKKTGRKVELLSPIPPPKVEEKKEEEKKGEEKPKVEEKKEEPVVIAVVLKVHMHCEACAQEIKKRILKMKGVQSAEPDIKSSQVTVKGVIDPSKLVEFVYKRTGKHAAIIKIDPQPVAEKPKEEKKPKEEEKKPEEKPAEAEKKEEGGEGAKDTKEGTTVIVDEAAMAAALQAAAAACGVVKVEPRRNPEFYYYYPRMDPYPPQIFSDENPNACSVM